MTTDTRVDESAQPGEPCTAAGNEATRLLQGLLSIPGVREVAERSAFGSIVYRADEALDAAGLPAAREAGCADAAPTCADGETMNQRHDLPDPLPEGQAWRASVQQLVEQWRRRTIDERGNITNVGRAYSACAKELEQLLALPGPEPTDREDR